MLTQRITASSSDNAVRIYSGPITAAAQSRTLGGMLVRYGVPGRTSAGQLRVRPGALRFPEDLTRVKLTREHNRDESRGYLATLEHTTDGIRAFTRVSDGPEGDAALREAKDRTRDGFSYDVVDAEIVGDEITSALVIAIGQVGIPAYEDSRIDTIAAAHHPNPGGNSMNAEQRARLAELRGLSTRTAEQEAELSQLAALEAANPESAQTPAAAPAPVANSPPAPAAEPAQVAASMPAIAPGVPAPSGSMQVTERNPLDRFIDGVVAGYASGNPGQITAALNDIVIGTDSTGLGSLLTQPAWSGELWSGLDYEPEFTPLLNSGPLDALEGKGWRFKVKPEIKDYAGNKAEIPTTTVEVEQSPWKAARMAVGNDFDRAFYDFPEQFAPLLRGYVKFVNESWAIKLDGKVRDFIIANAVAAAVDPQPSLLKAAAKAIRVLKRRRVGKATFIIANDDDFDTLMDVTNNQVPAFLELFGVDPRNFTSSDQVPQGQVLAGVKQTATVKTLPGSPLRVSAQHLANGGIDEAFFGYWAIEEHHPVGIASVAYEAPVVPAEVVEEPPA